MPLPCVQACRLPAVKPLPSVVKGIQACRLPALKPLKPLKCSGRSNLPFVSPQTPQNPKTPKMLRGSSDQALMPLSSVVKGVQACCLPAVRPLPSVVKRVQACRLPAVRSLPSVVKGVQACRLPALKPLKRLQSSAAASTRHCYNALTLRSSFHQALMPLPSVVKGVQAP